MDMEKLADGLQKLTEDDLLHVVQLVHDNKTAETYTKNDVESKTTSKKRKLCLDLKLINRRRRVSCRSLHAPGLAREAAMGLHGKQD